MAYDPGVVQVPYATVGGPADGSQPQSKPSSGWGPLLAMIGLGVTLLVGYGAYRVVTHFWFQPSPYSARRAATGTETTVVFPPRLAGFTRVGDGPRVKMPDLVRGLPGDTELRLATYDRGGAPAAVVGAAAIQLDARYQNVALEQITKGLTAQGGRVRAADPGPMGGRMVCATGNFGSLPYTACGYVDPGAFGVIYVYDQGPSVRASVLAIRAGVERRLA